MNSNYFYSNIVQSSKNKDFLEEVQTIAESIKQQIYVLASPLIDGKYQYNDDSLMIVLSSKRKIAFVTTRKMSDDFKDLCEDIIEDIGSISDKYGYKEKIGRPRKWRDKLTSSYSVKDIKDVRTWFCEDIAINDADDFRTLDLLVSLFIGSINDVKNITTEEPDNLLDKVKHKIQLFDGQQTRFIYEELEAEGQRITIQGLSGTGKTELLMHKLKDLYVKNEDAVFGFTCFNKILSRKLKERIPEFFNFMKVEQQIDWSRLLCVSAWGNYGNEYSGIYRYICSFYEISFYSLRECGSFDIACQKAIEQIRSKIDAYGHAFTYMFIDESQDFKESFFKLCELVTEKKCFIAGDIFQSIFEEKKKETVPPNFLLSKCYRTDPKTLMFAQALGMGLFEKEKLWWLDKEQWEQCGYNVKIEGKQYTLTREPLRRFEDVDPDFDSLKIIGIQQHIAQGTITLIKRIYDEFPTTKPDDIAIIFLDTDKYIYKSADDIERAIGLELGIECNIAYESKKTEKGKILISNKNNIKGLEYPFVICITKKILREKSYRNTMYTMLTRSFIRSYLVLPKGDDNGFTPEMYEGGQRIMKEKKIVVTEPTPKEQIDIKAWIKGGKQALSLEDRITNVFEELNITNPKIKETIRKSLAGIPMKNNNAQLKELIQVFLNTIEDEGNFTQNSVL